MSIQANPLSYFQRAIKPYCSLPANTGRRDEALLHLARRIDLSEPTLFADVGCGRGRLLGALAACRDPKDLANLHYLGIDAHREPLLEAQSFFDAELATTGARAYFLTLRDFRYVRGHVLVDQIAIIFAVHEFDPANLDTHLATLWRMLRRGGRIFIQDSAAAIHDEIEFLALRPEFIGEILEGAGAEVKYDTIYAGRRKVPVYLVEGKKPAGSGSSYWLPDLATITRNVIHRSLLSDCLALMMSRQSLEQGSVVDPEEVAAICHRLAVHARAYHQPLAWDEVTSRKAEYCLGCGAASVKVEEVPSNIKDPREISIVCARCGYRHHSEHDDGRDSEEAITEELFRFWEVGADDAGLVRSLLQQCLGISDARYLSVVRPFLQRIPGVTPQLIDQLVRAT